MNEVERAVWQAVRDGDRKGTQLSPGVVFARTGVRVTHAELVEAMGRLLADGRLYWRDIRTRRLLLAGEWPPSVADQPAEPDLWGEGNA